MPSQHTLWGKLLIKGRSDTLRRDLECELEQRLTAMAELIDRARLGPAHYVYSVLKKQSKRGANPSKVFTHYEVFIKGVKFALLRPPRLAYNLSATKLLFGSSRHRASAHLMRRVVQCFTSEEAVHFERTNSKRGGVLQLFDRLSGLLALPDALMYGKRVRDVLRDAGCAESEVHAVTFRAIQHRLSRREARSILTRSRARCIIIGNGNRRFEYALWAEARSRGVATVLLPYQEIMLKPGRFFSLCGGDFDLALPFSEYSATQLRLLQPNLHTVVTGYPRERSEPKQATAKDILYLSGVGPEPEAAPLLRLAFEHKQDRLRVRFHPRMTHQDRLEYFGWVSPQHVSDPSHISLGDDVRRAAVAISVWSTSALEAMSADVPVVWLAPEKLKNKMSAEPMHCQGVKVVEVTNAEELGKSVRILLTDTGERQRVIQEQHRRMGLCGYSKEYFKTVQTTLQALLNTKSL